MPDFSPVSSDSIVSDPCSTPTPLSRGLVRSLLTPFWLVLAACAGCVESEPGFGAVTEWVIQGDRPVRTFLPVQGDTAVLLVYAPSQCFTCDGELSRWMAISRDRGWRVHLLLTAQPSAGERDQLRLFRLEPAGVLKGAAARVTTPRVYRFAGPVLVDSAVGSPAENGLLSRAAGAGGAAAR